MGFGLVSFLLGDARTVRRFVLSLGNIVLRPEFEVAEQAGLHPFIQRLLLHRLRKAVELGDFGEELNPNQVHLGYGREGAENASFESVDLNRQGLPGNQPDVLALDIGHEVLEQASVMLLIDANGLLGSQIDFQDVLDLQTPFLHRPTDHF